MSLLAGNSVWQLVKQSDAMTTTVLLVLLILSVICWAVFIGKWLSLRSKRRNLRMILNRLNHVQSVDQLLTLGASFADTVPGSFISKNLFFYKALLESRGCREYRGSDWEMMQYHIDQTLDAAIAKEECYLSLLSTSAAVSPLLGLFGTVWGLVHAFVRISQKQSADIVTVAPGIAEALITTLAGLLVAIPALVMYNYLASRVRRIENLLVHLADRVGFILQQTLVR